MFSSITSKQFKKMTETINPEDIHLDEEPGDLVYFMIFLPGQSHLLNEVQFMFISKSF